MEGVNIVLIVLLFTAILVLGLFFISQGTRRFFEAEVRKGIDRTAQQKKQIITEEDIKHLPVPVQKYLAYVGVLGKCRVYSLKTVTEIEMNMGPDKGTPIMKTVEYDFFGSLPGRLAYMKFKLSKAPVFGLDAYIDGIGSMLMKPFGLFAVVNARGKDEDNSSAAVLLLLSMCAGAPAALIDSRIQWTLLNDYSVKASFDDGKCTVGAILEFNDIGQLINFSTEDKYYSPTGKSYQMVRWSTLLSDYREIKGLKLSTYGEAVWHFSEGDFCYGKSTLKLIEYNCTSLK